MTDPSNPSAPNSETRPEQAAQWNMLVEMCGALSSFVLLVVPLLVGTLAYLAHATPLAIFARMACAILVVGTLLAVLNWQLISAVLHSAAEHPEREADITPESINNGD